MHPKSKKKPGLLSRVASFFSGRGGRSDAVDSRQDSGEIVNTGAGPSWLDHPPIRSVPDLPHPGASSTLHPHDSQPLIRPSRSENEIVNSSQITALSMPSNQHLRRPPHQPLPASQSYDDPVSDLLHPVGSSIPQWHESQPPIRPPRSENNTVESSQSAALSMPSSQHLRQPPHQPLPAPQSYDDLAVPRVHEATTSFLAGASRLQMRDINYYEASHLPANRGGAGDNSIDGWELLLKETAPNALHNSRARYDAPKCDEDTRIEVTGEIMDWIQDRDGPQRLLCMTGAAGSGKSCLQQTAAEKCGRSNILAASFFLSAEDPTRNGVDPVIPTIAYQLGRRNERLKWLIKTTIEKDPLVFTQSLEAQTTALIVEPFEHMRDTGTDLKSLPYVILIDGLDECKGEDRQAELLTAIRRCLLADDLPFRIFIASRPEWAIRTALEPGGHLREMAYHIQLSDKYDASADMRRYLRRRFEDIGLRIRYPEWFSEGDIETLVRAASGQFIYVATVYKYISERRASPAERLKIVLTWTPHEGQATRPFDALDRLYSNVLLAAKTAYEAVDSHHRRDFLLLFRAHHIGVTSFWLIPTITTRPAADFLSALLRLEARAEETLISDLRSLVALETDIDGDLRLHLYHKSFSDFLKEPSRAKDMFVPESRVYAHLAKCFMQHIIECPPDLYPVPAKWEELPLPELDRHSLKEAVEDLPFFMDRALDHAIDDEVVNFTQNGGWQKINNLMPPLCREGEWLSVRFADWVAVLRKFNDNLKARKPEAAAVISVFAEKWTNGFKQYKSRSRLVFP